MRSVLLERADWYDYDGVPARLLAKLIGAQLPPLDFHLHFNRHGISLSLLTIFAINDAAVAQRSGDDARRPPTRRPVRLPCASFGRRAGVTTLLPPRCRRDRDESPGVIPRRVRQTDKALPPEVDISEHRGLACHWARRGHIDGKFCGNGASSQRCESLSSVPLTLS